VSAHSLPGCQACKAAEANPTTGLFEKACPDCQARSMAQSPFAFAARQSGKANKGMENGLAPTWPNVAAGVERVNHWMDTIKKHKEQSCQTLF